jgi:hypothetical protein
LTLHLVDILAISAEESFQLNPEFLDRDVSIYARMVEESQSENS